MGGGGRLPGRRQLVRGLMAAIYHERKSQRAQKVAEENPDVHAGFTTDALSKWYRSQSAKPQLSPP